MNKNDCMENYHLIAQIGEGSFGRVYKGRRKYTGKLVAVKMINKLGQSKEDLISFRREIDLLQKVSHPNVMRMLSVFETDTDFCVVSELARGDLFQVIDDNQTLPENVLKNVAAQLVSSLAHLHELHIIHRDMKPQNILIAEHGSLKICDFGFARALSQTTLVLTSIKGTPLYMAPELVQEQPYDEKVDIWALGVILYELYHGKPPFFTNSIYKLIQMIVNSPISWPDEISPQFKSFLLEMLQKDPSKRTSCQDLLKHPFISDVVLSKYDDKVYRFKSDQFERAIKTSLSGSRATFKPKKSKVPDFQMILVNPSSHSDEELLLAVQFLRNKNVAPDSPLAASFSIHFMTFLSKPVVIEEALLLAAELLRKDIERFNVPFACGINLLGTDMPLVAVEFLTELLSIPFAQNVIQNNDFQLGDMQLNELKCQKLRDRLLSFLFAESDEEMIGKTYSLISFFAQESEMFLDSICFAFAPQIVPILTSAITSKKSELIKTSAFCILSKIIEHDHDAIKFIQPFHVFLDSFIEIVNIEITSIESFSLFSAAISFIAIGISFLVEIPEFGNRFNVRSSLSTLNNFTGMMFDGKVGLVNRLSSLLLLGSTPPTEVSEMLCTMSVLNSPFCHIPMNPAMVDECAANITSLIPFHQFPLLETLFSLQPESVYKHIPSMIGLFVLPSCANYLSEYILNALSMKGNEDLVLNLCEAGILTTIASVICDLGPSVPPNVVILLAQIIMTFQKPTELLLDQATEILTSIFSIDSAVESGLLIASHLARISKEFLPALSECGALNLAERALQADIPIIRSRALDFIGNICRHTALPDEYTYQFIPLLIENLKENDNDCQKMAAYALGNVVFWSPKASEMIISDIKVINELLVSRDAKTVENTAGILGNIVRKSDKYVSKLIKEGSLEKLLNSIHNYEELQGRNILPLSYFCQYEEARQFLKSKNANTILAKYTNSPNDRIKRYSKSIIDSIT
ncbi:AGC family protein kinase [Tritrichomonas foetus]|uniref:non-specific serine/threonine protein kinase n=1 Tax=Tritrichomonas foetus TaxID=1144522 RepID=A0A1J4KEZ5_9EUKA|nr:AGC family protein kinase [Tritrichomonas foetus]|eukprot:OHT08166.1 AGC family protein kinase [Tritrichomonas foetus]